MKRLFIIILLLAEMFIAYVLFAPLCIQRIEYVHAFRAWRDNPTATTEAELDRQGLINTLYSLGTSTVAFGVMAGVTLVGVRIFKRRGLTHDEGAA